MFRGLREEIKRLNADVKNVANCARARALRKTLLQIGVPMAVVGLLGAFTCFILFATAGADGFGESGFTARLLVPFVLFVPCGLLGGIGVSIARLGLQILITGYAANLVDEAVGNNCPRCKAPVKADAVFCSACGAELVVKCAACATVNDTSAKFCKNCGKAL